VGYVHKGVVLRPASLPPSATSLRHVFRYDLSLLFSRLHDEVKRIPVVGSGGSIHFVDAPRRYRVPVLVRVHYEDESHEQRVTLVLDKRGLQRVEPGGGEGENPPSPARPS